MSGSAIAMMIIGCTTVWGGLALTIHIALSCEKKNLKKTGS